MALVAMIPGHVAQQVVVATGETVVAGMIAISVVGDSRAVDPEVATTVVDVGIKGAADVMIVEAVVPNDVSARRSKLPHRVSK